MSKHIVKKIWIWIIGLSLVASIGVTVFVDNRNINSACNSTQNNYIDYILDNFSYDKAYAQVPIETYDIGKRINNDGCEQSKQDILISILGSLPIIFSVGLAIGGILSVITEIIYFICREIRFKDGHINWKNILASIVIPVVFVLFSFLMYRLAVYIS